MTRIVCQVLQRPERVTFIWSEQGTSFEPYRLSETETERFYRLAGKAREQLADGVSAALAETGQELYRLIFRDTVGDPLPGRVRAWLAGQKAITSLEIVSDAPGRIPWNLVYDGERGPFDPTKFWGVRYPLAVGRRVNPLRINPVVAEATVLLALDSARTAEMKDAWQQETRGRTWDIVDSAAHLKIALESRCPDVLYFDGAVADGQLILGAERIALADLRTWIDDAEEGSVEPLVFLNVTGLTLGWADFLARAARTFPGLICWEYSPGELADALGRSILTQMVHGQLALARLFQQIRASQPTTALGLSSFCPGSMQIGGEPAEPAETYALPEEPYRPLAAYEREARPLFAGRDRDIHRFASLLDEATTGLVLLHGLPGVGKTSFLQAGVVPFLEEDSVGFLAWRDRELDDREAPDEMDNPVLIIRASGDLAGQLAEALCVFCAKPFVFTVPGEETRTISFPERLREALCDQTSPSDVAETPIAGAAAAADEVSPVELGEALAQNADLLGGVLDSLTRDLPKDLVILIEHGEELLTQTGQTPSPDGVRFALDMLVRAARRADRCKIVLSLRTDYLGRLIENFATELGLLPWRAYCLPELNDAQLLEAVLLPTATEPVPFADEAPFEKYGFGYADKFDAQLIAQIRTNAGATGHGVTALLQVVCARLVVRASRRRQTILDAKLLKDVGGVGAALGKTVDERLARLDLRKATRLELRRFLGTLGVRQPEGSITRKVVSVEEAHKGWRGGDPFEAQKALTAAEEAGLLEIQPLLLEGREDFHVTPAQDSLARLGLEWGDEQKLRSHARTKVIDTLWITIPLIFLAAAVTLFLTRRHFAAELGTIVNEAQINDSVLRSMATTWFTPKYVGDLHLARDAWQTGDVLALRKYLLRENGGEKILFEKEERDPRGFEWFYLWRLANSQRLLLAGHAAPVLAVVVSPDGKLAATGSSEGKLFLWDLATGTKRATLAHDGAVRALAFSDDGQTLASAGSSKNIRLWDLGGVKDKHVYLDKPARSLTGHTNDVLALVYRDKALISASADETVIFWDTEKLVPLHTLKEHKGAVHALAVAGKSKFVASGGADGKIILWNAATAAKASSIDASGKITALAFAPDGTVLAAGSTEAGSLLDTGSIRLWDPATGKAKTAPEMKHGTEVFALVFAADGKTLFSAGRDPVVRLWNPAEGDSPAVGVIKGHLGWVRSLAMTPDGLGLVTGSQDADAKVWSAQPTADADVLTPGVGPLAALAISSDDKVLAAGGNDGNIYLWSLATGKLLETVKGLKGTITSLVFSQVSKPPKLAAACKTGKDEGELKVWEVELDDKGKLNTKELFARTDKTTSAECVAMAQDGKLVAYAGSSGKIVLWELDKSQNTRELVGHQQPVHCLSFNSESKFLASGSSDQKIRLWHVASGQPGAEKPFSGHTGAVLSVRFLPTNMLVSGGTDQMFNVWSPEQNVPNKGFRLHSGPVSSIALSSSLFSGSWDHTVKIWDPERMVKSGKFEGERLTLTGHTAPVRAVATTSDGLLLASTGDDGTIRLWRAARR